MLYQSTYIHCEAKPKCNVENQSQSATQISRKNAFQGELYNLYAYSELRFKVHPDLR